MTMRLAISGLGGWGTAGTLFVLVAACGGGAAQSPSSPGDRAARPEEASPQGHATEPTPTGVSLPTEIPSNPEAVSVVAPPSLEPPPEQAAPPAQSLAPAPQRLPAPTFAQQLAAVPSPVRGARLVRISRQRNQVTDQDAWFQRNGLPRPFVGPQRGRASPGFAVHPSTHGGLGLIRVVSRPDHAVRFYGPNFGGGPLVWVVDSNGRTLASFDFTNWVHPPTGRVGQYTDMWPQYAEVRDGVLYISHAHRTYAAESGGRNAYLSAIDLPTGQLLWRTGPLVSNVRSFAIVGDVIVTGYGFTDEKDELTVIDRATGRRLHRQRLASGPGYIIEHQGRLFVRTYNQDYVFEVRVRSAP
ncbi:MAG: PQQ-binding-like beta-propeller repeat protein [Deltaproteobacteria bacterium]|nr:PQQ-binding-like beta-propeller repeat protein [Deltaproteobacteria bacterium]